MLRIPTTASRSPSRAADAEWEFVVKKRFGPALKGAELWALYEFFDAAFPHADLAVRRMLWCRDVEYEATVREAMKVALSLLIERSSNGLGAPSEELHRRIADFGIAGGTHVALEQLRSSSVERSDAIGTGPDANGSRTRVKVAANLVKRLDDARQALVTLPPVDAQLVVMNGVFGMAPEEIGFVLGLPARRVQRRLDRAQRKLAQAIEWKAAS